MRSTFSSIVHKRIFTLSFDRATKVNEGLYKKLQNSIKTKGVVITTPTAIKSILLRYLEALYVLEDESRQRPATIRSDVQQLSRILQLLRDGCLIMDEVDLILHPLKSELNFPIGAKHDLDFSPLRWKLPIHLLDAIFYAERGTHVGGLQRALVPSRF